MLGLLGPQHNESSIKSMLPFKLEINSNMLSFRDVSSSTAEQLLSLWELSLLSLYICPSISFSPSAETLYRAIWMSDRQNRYKTCQRQVSTLWVCCQTLYKESDSVEQWAESDRCISTPGPHEMKYLHSDNSEPEWKSDYVIIIMFQHFC